MSELTAFTFPGVEVRFGATADGVPYAIAADYARALGYSTTQKALQVVDADEKGQENVAIWVTSEVNDAGQSVGEWRRRKQWVIYEDGMWELIFRSTLPGAKAIKKQVKEILREIRKTGRYVPEPAAAEETPAVPPVLLIEPGRDDTEVWAWSREGADVRFLHAMPHPALERAARALEHGAA